MPNASATNPNCANASANCNYQSHGSRALSALQMVLNVERSKTIDLPNVLRAVN